MNDVTFFRHDITYGGKRVEVQGLPDLADLVLTGNWSTGLLNTEHRALLNWVGSDFLAVDIDGDLPLHVAVERMAASGLRYFVGTTSSHQKMKGQKPPTDRYRIVVQLTSRCVDLGDWAATYGKVTADLGLPADPQARDAVRYWKPCQSIVSLKPEGATVDIVRAAPPATEHASARPAGMVQDLESARRDIADWPVAVAGQNGSGVCMGLAARLIRGYGLTVDQALVEMEPWNVRCQPAWTEQELRHKLQDAETKGKTAWGFRFYQGTKAEVLTRALPKYGAAGSAGVPYRVWPDGRMEQQSSEDAVRMAIHEIWKEASGEEASIQTIDNAFRWWKAKVAIVAPAPKPVVVNEEPGPALCRVETAPGPMPAWNEFLTRLSAPDTFLAWVWMLTLETASRQILWLQGDGQDGKSVVSGVLTDALGAAAMSMDDSFMDKAERWMGSAVFGKRLVVVDDTKMRQLSRRGPIHRLSGRSPMTCEFKGQQGFSFQPNVAILCTSNMQPEIGDNRADMSRLLPLTVTSSGRPADRIWPKRLASELPQLFYRAREAYGRLCIRPGEAQLQLEVTAAQLLQEAADTDARIYRERMENAGLMFGEGEMSGRELMARLGENDPGARSYIDFCAWLKRQGVVKVKTRTGSTWRGIVGAA